MPRYEIVQNYLKIYFEGKPSEEIRRQMKAIGIWWNPSERCWGRELTTERLELARLLCERQEEGQGNMLGQVRQIPTAISIPMENYGLKLKIRDIVNGSEADQQRWKQKLKAFVNARLTEDNSGHAGEAVGGAQEAVWFDCFQFIKRTLAELPAELQEFELIFEYILPGRVYERPDVLLLTNNKVLILEFKKKRAPQIDDNKDDVAQVVRYREWTENHHQVTKERGMQVKGYLVCTPDNARSGLLRSVAILTSENFCQHMERELGNHCPCDFADEWTESGKTEMPDMLRAIEMLYARGEIPYLADVNRKCLDKVKSYIDSARTERRKILIFISGVPGAGKTAVGQSVVFDQNRGGNANAVYLSGNGPLVEVLQDEMNRATGRAHAGENAVQGMKEFKADYFDYNHDRRNENVPQQAILIFDEAQRAWDAEKLGRGFSEPEGLLRVGDKVGEEHEYAVIIGLYGNGQVIYNGEEAGMKLWAEALKCRNDWTVYLPENLDSLIFPDDRKVVDEDLFLPVSLRADFVDCSKWVEAVVTRDRQGNTREAEELRELQKTSMQIFMTRDFDQVRRYAQYIRSRHPAWKYGLLVSKFAEATVLTTSTGWSLGFGRNNHQVRNGSYGAWFHSECMRLEKACSVYGCQGLELDCPIVLFGGDYVMKDGNWEIKGYQYNRQREDFDDPDTIVENNYRVLLTRARRQMLLFVPRDSTLDETYRYFLEMGVDVFDKVDF